VGQTSRLPYQLGGLSGPPHKMGNLFLGYPLTNALLLWASAKEKSYTISPNESYK
jgi:hypothetical protein